MTRAPTASACLACLIVFSTHALAQRADDNAVTAAEDAFGATIGDESIGLYSSTQVRGFSPVAAGNVRIEGLYFDRQMWLSSRLIEGSAVRMGLAAHGYPFPAPTGIVDYRLHKAGDERVVSVAAGLDPYTAPSIELDAKLPLIPERLAVAGGVSYAHEEYYDGADAHHWRAAIIPRWRPSEQIEVIPFWTLSRGRDEEVAPTIVTAGPYAPPRIERRQYFGQTWADVELDGLTYGVLAKARVGGAWAFAGGVFRSIYGAPQRFADVYVDTQPDGSTRELVIADPAQRYASTSGELRASRSFADGARLHIVHLTIRARDRDSRYRGSAAPLDLGWRPLGERTPTAEPDSFAFGERTRDAVRQSTAGLMYEGRWREVGEASVGVQRTRYEKEIRQPGLAAVSSQDDPWLWNAALAAHLTRSIALYSSYTQGLEESGVAPDSAANRNEALPAIRTRQFDAGLRWAITPHLKLVAGGFDIRKPYFTTDEQNVFGPLGELRHRGVELSFSGAVTAHWNVVAGAVLMSPRVSGEAVDAGRIGQRPVGQSERVLRANVEYRPPQLDGWSFDLGVSNYDERIASSDNLNVLPGYTLIDVGARYRTAIGRAPATLRVLAGNFTDEFYWSVFSSNTFGLTDGRRYAARLTVDF